MYKDEYKGTLEKTVKLYYDELKLIKDKLKLKDEDQIRNLSDIF